MGRIRRIRVFRVELPLKEGRYAWSGGRFVEVFDSTVVVIDTDDDRVGCGEVCPLGPAYLPAFAQGARAAIAELAPVLLGQDPRSPARLMRLMDQALLGHPYAKSALDMAIWDLAAQYANAPLCDLIGGRYGDSFVLYRAISQDTPERMAASVAYYREEGYRRFQLKVGGDPLDDIQRIRFVADRLEPGDRLVADANMGWLPHDARRVVRGVRDCDVYIEQPCRTYEACLSVRRAADHPMILDESIDSFRALLRAASDRAADAVNLKISKLGGITRLVQARDACTELDIAMTIEDSWGSDIITAAIAHLAHSTPPEYLFSSTDFNSYVTVSTAEGAPQRQGGRMAAPTSPGLGITPRWDVLGDPVAIYE